MFCFIFSLSFFFCSFFEVFWEGRWREEKGRELKCWQKKTQLLPLKERKREIGRREDRWRRRQKKKKNQKEMEQKKKKHVLLEASTTMSIGWSCSTEGRLMENKEQQGKKKTTTAFTLLLLLSIKKMVLLVVQWKIGMRTEEHFGGVSQYHSELLEDKLKNLYPQFIPNIICAFCSLILKKT